MKNTTLCYLERDGRVLMLHRVLKKNDMNEGKWVGVGGKFEYGESPEECLVREVREETGYALDSFRLRGIVTFSNTKYEPEYIYLYTSSSFSGSQKECSEGILKWIPRGDILGLNLWEGDRIFLRLLEENSPLFSLKLEYDGDKLTGSSVYTY
ncbi:MAG: NUDIX hydrolase [Oscillospiraceae bacterium]|jgi:8-oxo-dGTP diphosphatase